jgi:predicted Zn-dependent protease
MTRVVWPGVWIACSVTLATLGVARAGNSRANPPINVVPPTPGPAMYPDDLPGPPAEVRKNLPHLALPTVPAFDLPATEPGFHGPRALRVHGRAALGHAIQVKGYVTWIYDCAAELAAANPRATRAQILESIDGEPTLCERPMFSLGDARTTPPSASIWVVDVPRAPSKPERDQRSAAELKAWPAVPRIAVGDYVVVSGTWAIQSPHGERNTDGLLVYQALARATPTPAPAPAPEPEAAAPQLEIDIAPDVPLRKIVDTAVRNASVDHLNACNKALVARQYDAAIAECEAATAVWDDNHLAWYATAGAHLAKAEWSLAQAAIDHAVTLRPDQAMYQLYDGIARYEGERQRAREAQAGAEHKRADDVVIDPAQLRLDDARDALTRAVRLEPALWRAHYYLGRVYRDLDDARRAALHLTRAVATNPSHRFGYVALIELYRRWGYVDQALAVAMLGTHNVAPSDASELWFEAGMAYDAQHADDKAIDALGRAIAGRPDDASAKLQRAQIFLRRADLGNARRDLEDVARSAEPRAGAARQIARQLLEQLAVKDRPPREPARDARGYWKVYRPSEQPYKPWTAEDAKYRM